MNTVSQRRPGLPEVDFYAPRFRVSALGGELGPEVINDVLQVKVSMQKDGLTGFSLTLNNWDESLGSFPGFKYSDGDTFNIGTELHVEMGYADDLVSMVTGPVTSLTPKFPQSGASSIEVSGTDTLFRLKGSKPKEGDRLIFTKMADWEIAQYIADKNQIPIVVTREGPVHDCVVQPRDQDDALFLLDRARRIEFELYMQFDADKNRQTLFFVKPTDGRDSRAITVFDFSWGVDLIDFSPKLSVNDQVSSVTVKGWNPKTKKPIEYTATERDLPQTPGRGGSGPASAGEMSQRGKQDVVVDAAVTSEEEARRLAISRLVKQAYQYKTGSARVIGQPRMHPGDNVKLHGLGERFSGSYYVTKVDHSIGASGYITSFEVEALREKQG